MRKKYMIIYLLLIIPLFLISCKKEDNDIPISLNTVDINAINNNKLLQIIDDDSLDGGIYLIQTKSNQYIYFNGNEKGYNNISCTLNNRTLIITANTEDNNKNKKLYLINQKNITSSDEKNQFYDTIKLIVNDEEVNFSNSILLDT